MEWDVAANVMYFCGDKISLGYVKVVTLRQCSSTRELAQETKRILAIYKIIRR